MKKPFEAPMNLIFGVIIVLAFVFLIYFKILGASNLPLDVEKNGFCKQYGQHYYNQKGTNFCTSMKVGDWKHKFTDEEFRNHCPKNKFFSTKIYSDCFHASGGIN